MELALLLFVFLVIFLIAYSGTYISKEKFGGSNGGYLISWDVPENVKDYKGLRYHIIIQNYTGGPPTTVFETSDLATNYYKFTSGAWLKKYYVTVSAIADSEGPSTSQLFTTGSGPPTINTAMNWNVSNILDTNGVSYSIRDLVAGLNLSQISLLYSFAPGQSKVTNATSMSVQIDHYSMSSKSSCKLIFDNVQVNNSGNTLLLTLDLGTSDKPCYSNQGVVNYVTSSSGCSNTCPLTLGDGDTLNVQIITKNEYGTTSSSFVPIMIDAPTPQAPANLSINWTD